MSAGHNAIGPTEISPRAPVAPTVAHAQNHPHRVTWWRWFREGVAEYASVPDILGQLYAAW